MLSNAALAFVFVLMSVTVWQFMRIACKYVVASRLLVDKLGHSLIYYSRLSHDSDTLKYSDILVLIEP